MVTQMRLLFITAAPTFAALYLYLANRMLGWADHLMAQAENIRRATET